MLLPKNPTEVNPIASITKLMTSLVVLEADPPMSDMVTITEDDENLERQGYSRLRRDTRLTRAAPRIDGLREPRGTCDRTQLPRRPEGVDRKHERQGAGVRNALDPLRRTHGPSNPEDLAKLVMQASSKPTFREYSTDDPVCRTGRQSDDRISHHRPAGDDSDMDHRAAEDRLHHGSSAMPGHEGHHRESPHCDVMNSSGLQTRLAKRPAHQVLARNQGDQGGIERAGIRRSICSGTEVSLPGRARLCSRYACGDPGRADNRPRGSYTTRRRIAYGPSRRYLAHLRCQASPTGNGRKIAAT